MIHFDIAKISNDLKILEEETLKEDFWKDINNSNNVLSKIKKIKNKLNEYENIENEIKNLNELTDLVNIEPDEDIAKDIIKNTKKLQVEIEKLEVSTLLNGKYDANNAIVTIHPGARRNRITRLGRNVISYVYKMGR